MSATRRVDGQRPRVGIRCATGSAAWPPDRRDAPAPGGSRSAALLLDRIVDAIFAQGIDEEANRGQGVRSSCDTEERNSFCTAARLPRRLTRIVPRTVASRAVPQKARTKIPPTTAADFDRRWPDHDPDHGHETVGIRAVSMKTMRARGRKMMVGDRIFTSPFCQTSGPCHQPTTARSYLCQRERQRAGLADFSASRLTMVVTAA